MDCIIIILSSFSGSLPLCTLILVYELWIHKPMGSKVLCYTMHKGREPGNKAMSHA